MNGAFDNLLKHWQLTYEPSPGRKTDFVWLIAREFFTWHSNTFVPEKQCKKYR